MKTMEISMAAIWEGPVCHLQKRPSVKKIGAAGLVGCFGGSVKKGESSLEAVAREISEETTLKVTPENFGPVGQVEVESDRNGQPVLVTANVYSLLLSPGKKFEPRPGHGELASWTMDEVIEHQNELTPATKAAFKELLGVL